MPLFFSVIIIFLSTFYLIKLLNPFLSLYLLDSPEKRSSHKVPVPTGAGIAFVITMTFSSFLFKWYIPLLCLPLAIVGFIDDKLNISRFVRYGVQILTAILIIQSSLKTNINLAFLSEINFLNFILILILILIITSVINFSNFMDGLDGFLGCNYFVAFFYFAIFYDSNLFLLTSAILSFLIFNWYPAKVFMGDVGSTFLGAIFIGLVIQDGEFIEMFSKLLILSPIFMDSFFTLIRRIINKQSFFNPHKLHLYQRLSQSRFSHSQITLIYAFGVLTLCIISTFRNIYLLAAFILLEFIFGVYLSSIAKPFKD